MRVSDYNYNLPRELIAQFPPHKRGLSRLLVLDKLTGKINHRNYLNIVDLISPGDVVILNNTRVIKARLVAYNGSGQTRELLLLEDHHNTDMTRRKVIYRGKIREKEVLHIGDAIITINQIFSEGIAEITCNANILNLADNYGSVPLPPYMQRLATNLDTERYQTVFARQPGSVAAPTASLNFTDQLKNKLIEKGAEIAYLTLHVGLGTFLPIRSDEVENHEMHSEYFEVPEETVGIIQKIRANNGNIVAIGTTVARTLEYLAERILYEPCKPLRGEADIFIYPGYEFKVVNTLLTNFHAPKSTVLMLAAAFAGWNKLEHAYNEAIKEKYSFLSYGDSMLIV